MIVDNDPRRQGPYQGRPPVGSGYSDGQPLSALRRFLGGSPMAVLVKLLFLSILVGAIMATLGITPGLLFWHIYDAGRALIDLGFETFHDFGRWILAGAVVVVPLWLLSRFLSVSK
ncbi:DUF6460 domain-containing protein [Methylobacterium bullatum]|uniref:DUF6460 domain-containing protein n=1 Tax=Methylobacterium bullatum TaxID=570505 RepID=A0AAV4ZCN5_9HYPH|nr:DUF6460 domain-containing protein [Methylobacterium bullatum]MBD8905021.1 hypothetical protein [Methylobacterium bullatum]GJD41543.1 hypothetical protein OICFNHDK_4026 [Methylobacterium bullatum]